MTVLTKHECKHKAGALLQFALKKTMSTSIQSKATSNNIQVTLQHRSYKHKLTAQVKR